VGYPEAMLYFRNLAIFPFLMADQLINTLLGGNPWETISSSVGKQAAQGVRWALVVEKIIDAVMGQGHCRRNIIMEAGQ
jgi:hypothetical protein